jgi:chaperonin cofactor prefoldin
LYTTRNRLGNQAFTQKNYAEAIQYYTQAIRFQPTNHVFFSNRSASYAKECIRLDPSFLKGYFRLATAQLELRDLEAAMATLRQGLAVDANHLQLLKLQRTIQQKTSSLAAADNSISTSTAGSTTTMATGGMVLDHATQQELEDLQTQNSQTVQEYGIVEANLVKTKREYRVHELTKQELQAQVPLMTTTTTTGGGKSGNSSAGVTCYRSIGKMFLVSTRERVEEHLVKTMEDLQKKETDLTSKLDYLERRIKSQRQNMSELLAPVVGAATE